MQHLKANRKINGSVKYYRIILDKTKLNNYPLPLAKKKNKQKQIKHFLKNIMTHFKRKQCMFSFLGFMTYSLLKGWNKFKKNKDLLFYFLIKRHGTSCFLHKTVFNVKLMYNHGIKMIKRQVKRVFFFSVLFFCTNIFLLVAEPLIARRPEVKTYSYTIFSGTLLFCILVQGSSC